MKLKIDIGNGKEVTYDNIDPEKKTVADLKQMLHDREGLEIAALNLLHGGVVLSDEKTLASYGMGGNIKPVRISVAFKVLGGAQMPDDKADAPDFSHPKLRVSHKVCQLMLCEDDVDNVEFVDCGHVFAPSALRLWAKDQLEQQTGFNKFVCPGGCGKELPFDLVCCATGWAEIVGDYFYKLYQGARLDKSKFKNCRYCATITFKPGEVQTNRVHCPNKKNCLLKDDWCWLCCEPWNGIHQCDSPLVAKNKDLACCSMKEFSYNGIDWGQVPTIRACIKCYTFMQHTTECPKVKCPSCKTEYCFVCLKVWSQCKNIAKHAIAPRQVLS